MKEYILLDDGTQVVRDRFLTDLKVGTHLFSAVRGNNGYTKTDEVCEYEVVEIGRKYATLVEITFGKEIKMSLDKGQYIHKGYTQFNFDFYATKEEVLATAKNSEERHELNSIIHDVIYRKLQPKQIRQLNELIQEMLSENAQTE